MQAKYSNPMIHKAFHLLNELSSIDEARLQARARERAIITEKLEIGFARKKGLEEGLKKGQTEGLKKGLEKGMLNAQIAFAKKLKQKGMSDDEISQLTSLNISEMQT